MWGHVAGRRGSPAGLGWWSTLAPVCWGHWSPPIVFLSPADPHAWWQSFPLQPMRWLRLFLLSITRDISLSDPKPNSCMVVAISHGRRLLWSGLNCYTLSKLYKDFYANKTNWSWGSCFTQASFISIIHQYHSSASFICIINQHHSSVSFISINNHSSAILALLALLKLLAYWVILESS